MEKKKRKQREEGKTCAATTEGNYLGCVTQSTCDLLETILKCTSIAL